MPSPGEVHTRRDSSATRYRMVYTPPAEVYSTRDAFPRAEPEMNLIFLSTYYPGTHGENTGSRELYSALFSPLDVPPSPGTATTAEDISKKHRKSRRRRKMKEDKENNNTTLVSFLTRLLHYSCGERNKKQV